MSHNPKSGRSGQKRKPGPEAETLQIPGDWKDAVAAALWKGKPPAAKTGAKKARKKKRSS